MKLKNWFRKLNSNLFAVYFTGKIFEWKIIFQSNSCNNELWHQKPKSKMCLCLRQTETNSHFFNTKFHGRKTNLCFAIGRVTFGAVKCLGWFTCDVEHAIPWPWRCDEGLTGWDIGWTWCDVTCRDAAIDDVGVDWAFVDVVGTPSPSTRRPRREGRDTNLWKCKVLLLLLYDDMTWKTAFLII